MDFLFPTLFSKFPVVEPISVFPPFKSARGLAHSKTLRAVNDHWHLRPRL
jgi:hypothetical protein